MSFFFFNFAQLILITLDVATCNLHLDCRIGTRKHQEHKIKCARAHVVKTLTSRDVAGEPIERRSRSLMPGDFTWRNTENGIPA